MIRLDRTVFLASLVLVLLSINVALATRQVAIDYLYEDPRDNKYWSPDCESCMILLEEYLAKNTTMYAIIDNYTSQVVVNWINYSSPEGQEKREQYNVTQRNSMVIQSDEGNTTTIQDRSFNETYIYSVIDSYLANVTPPPPPPSTPLMAVLLYAFVAGVFETVSPCLLALLSFALSHTLGKAAQFREGLIQVIAFGVGFVSAAILLISAVALMMVQLGSLYDIIVVSVCVFGIVYSLNLLGLNFTRFLKIDIGTKSVVRDLTKKYAVTFLGLLLLGFMFYFLDPCLAPVVAANLPALSSEHLTLSVVAFGLGTFIPFIGIGILAGSISRLARTTYRHKAAIRAISGLILLFVSIYILYKLYLISL